MFSTILQIQCTILLLLYPFMLCLACTSHCLAVQPLCSMWNSSSYFQCGDNIMDTMNEYARISLGRMPPQRCSLFRRWRHITLPEIKAFVGLIVNMGLVQLSDIKDYWSPHVTLHLPFFRTVFPQDHFLQIYWMLHVGEIPSTTRRSKIQPFLDLLLPLFHSYLTPFREVSADEAMIAFRGHVAFRQYVKGKP